MAYPGLGIADVVARSPNGTTTTLDARPHFDGREDRGRIRTFYSQCPLDQNEVREALRGTGLTAVQARRPGSNGYIIMYGRGMAAPEAGSTITDRSLYDGKTEQMTVDWSARDPKGQNGPGAIAGALFGLAVAGPVGVIVFTGAGALAQEVASDPNPEEPHVRAHRVLNAMNDAAPYGVSCALQPPFTAAGVRRR